MQKIFFQDNQVHSTYSDGTFSVEDILAYNQTHDKLDITFTDHVRKETDWFPKYVKRLQQLKKQYKDFSIRIGCEVKILDDGTLNTTEAILKQCEVILGSVHHFEGIQTMSPAELMKREYELATLLAQNKKITILSHPFSMGYRFHKSNPPIAHVEALYRLCVKNNILFEFNDKNCPPSVHEFVRKLVKEGKTAHLSFGSDMHTDVTELGRSGFALQQRVSVLVTGAGAGVGQSILKALKKSLVPLRIVIADGSELAGGLYRGDVAYLIPFASDKKYIPRIIEICKKEQIDMLFAGTDVELEMLSLHAKEITQKTDTVVIVSPTRAVRIADDKWKTVQFLKENGFPYPKSTLAKDIDSFVKTVPFPLIVKPRVGARSIGLYKVNNRQELERALTNTPNAIIQEYLGTEDDEFTCSGFFYKGKNYGVMCGRRWLRNGDTYKTHFFHDKKLEEFIASVGKKLSLNGPCNFQLRQTKKGPVIFEINCRFSGTTGAMSHLGFNIANALVQVHALKRAPMHLDFADSWMFRYWNEIFVPEKQVQTLKSKGRLDTPISETNTL